MGNIIYIEKGNIVNHEINGVGSTNSFYNYSNGPIREIQTSCKTHSYQSTRGWINHIDNLECLQDLG